MAKGGGGPFVQLMISGNKLAAEIVTATAPNFVPLYGTTTALDDGNFHHVAMVVSRSTQNAKLYVDGNLEFNTTSTAISGNLDLPGDLFIGVRRSGQGDGPFNGLMDETTVYRRALSAAQIQAIYSGGSAGKSAALVVLEDSGPVTTNTFATSISAGPANESSQVVSFTVTNDNNALFSSQPAMSTAGTLTFTPALNAYGTATVTVTAQDDGGTANSGVDTSAAQTFTITVTALNDAPTITFSTNLVAVLEDSGAYSGSLATFTTGPANESSQSITSLVVNNNNTALFSSQPTLSAGGTLTFTPAANANGSATVTVIAQDNGGTANGGVDKTTNTLTITITPVNDAPSFALPAGATGAAGATWTAQASGNHYWVSIASSADGTKLAAVDGNNGLIYTSPDSGVTWTAQASGNKFWRSIASSSDGSKLAAVDANDGQIYTSPDSGVTWTAQNSGNHRWSSIASSSDGSKLAAVDANDGQIYTSPDSGVTWTAQNSGNQQWSSIASSADGTKLAAGASGGQIYTSVNGGTNWTAQASGNRTWSAIASSADGTKLAAVDGNNGLIYTSPDSGVTWTAQASGQRAWKGIASSADGSKLAAVDQSGGLIYTSVGVAGTYDLTVAEDSGTSSTTTFATSISAGPANESSQVVSFTATNDNNALFSSQPAIAANGTLTFTPAGSGYGSATVTVIAQDNGGTANGGVDTSAAQTFTITVTPLATRVFLSGATPTGRQGETLVVPILLKAVGTENAVGFTLNFDTSKLTYAGTALGANSTGASLLENAVPAASGRVGLVLTRGAGGGAFSAGTNELLLVSFTVSPTATVGTTPVTFTDVTARREVTDASATVIATAFVDSSVTIVSAVAGTPSDYEGDVAPRPYGTGNGSVTVADAVLIGRFAAGLDTANTANGEFQRADCAPLGSKGDGRVTVADWVQALRFASALDTPGAVGGPTMQATALMAASTKLPAGTRVVRVAGGSLVAGRANTVSVQLDAQGNEAGLQFSLGFDPAVLTFVSASAGSGAPGAAVVANTQRAGLGRVGLLVVMPAGSSVAAGTRDVLTLTFTVNGAGSTAVTVLNHTAASPREVADVNANPMGATYVGGSFNILLPAGLKAASMERAADGSLRLVVRNSDGTPITAAQAARYAVHVTSNLGGVWTLLPNALVVENGALKIVDPAATSAGLRLYKLVELP